MCEERTDVFVFIYRTIAKWNEILGKNRVLFVHFE